MKVYSEVWVAAVLILATFIMTVASCQVPLR